MDEENVTFSVKDYRNKGNWKQLTLKQKTDPLQKSARMPEISFKTARYGNAGILEELYGIKVCVCRECGGHLGKPQLRMPLRS